MTYLPRGVAKSGRKHPAQDARAVFYGVSWREVPDFHWALLVSFANEFTLAAMGTGVGVVNGRLVQFAGH